jgi:hypothetical protein
MAGVPDNPRGGLKTSRSFVAGRNLPTAKTLSLGTAGLLAFLFLLRVSPVMAYRLHLPLVMFYVLLIGGAIVGLVLRRRWARLLPREPRVDYEHMEWRAARREAILQLKQTAFRLVPTLAAVASIMWFLLIHPNSKWVTFSIGFAVVWNVVSRPIWQALVLPHLRRT